MKPDQNARVIDIVYPLFVGTWSESTFAYQSSVGTCFLIGKAGFAITAAHVVEQMLADGPGTAAGYQNRDGQWTPIRILEHELHPSEDVAVIKLERIPMGSWLTISSRSENQSLQYDSWGYPIAVAEFAKKHEGAELESPELIYTHGYIRRRISRPLPYSIYRGTAFYEMSDIAGGGCSGGPVIRRVPGSNMWEVFGIYIGESEAPFPVSYSVRTDAIHGWNPSLIGRSIRAESHDM